MVLPGKTKDVVACSRLVTLPDWQGLGLAMNLIDHLGALYRATGKRVHTYPANVAAEITRSAARPRRPTQMAQLRSPFCNRTEPR